MLKTNKYIDIEYLKNNNIKKQIIEYENKVLSSIVTPAVSVILITYNHKNFISKAIEGIINQKTNFDYEIIIGDDDSDDGTRDICIEFAKKFPERIRLILHSRENNVKVLNKSSGIFQIIYNHLVARGMFVAICSGDDQWTDFTKLQKQYNHITAYANCSLVYHDWVEMKIFDKDNSELSNIKKNGPKASTTMYRNIKTTMPIRMLNVIQEDVFTRFILREFGNFLYVNGISPTIINTPNDSITRSMNILERAKHILNVNKQIWVSYKSTSRKKEAFKFYIKSMKSLLISKRYSSVRASILFLILQEIAKSTINFDSLKSITRFNKNINHG